MKKAGNKKKEDNLTISQPFMAVVKKNPESRLQMVSPRYFLHQLAKFKDGESVMLYLTNRRPKRTLAQNAYYWGVYLPLISKETGEPNLARLHELFKGMFLTEAIVEVLGQKVRMKKSTTELSVSDFSDYIMKIHAETGIEPPPTENYGLEALKK